MAEKISMLDTIKNKDFRYLTDLIRQCDIRPVDSGSFALIPVGCF